MKHLASLFGGRVLATLLSAAVGNNLGEATIGRFGGLTVFNRALTEAEMKSSRIAANIPALDRAAAPAKY